jgi:predicted signal transduction protein with EAL and GGDEF domain
VEFPRIAGTTELLLARADEAMYAAKRAGGGRIYRAHANGVAELI